MILLKGIILFPGLPQGFPYSVEIIVYAPPAAQGLAELFIIQGFSPRPLMIGGANEEVTGGIPHPAA